MLKRLNDYLIYCNNPAFIVVACVLGVILNIILSFIPYKFLNVNLADQNDILANAPFGAKLVIGVIVGPFFETLIFQFPPVFIVKQFIPYPKSKHYILLGMLFAMLFSLTHPFSNYYYVYAFIMGAYFLYIAVLSEFLRKQRINIFISVLLVHACINLVATLFDQL